MTAVATAPLRASSRLHAASAARPGWSGATTLVAIAVPVLLGAGLTVHSTLTVGMAAAIALLPVSVRAGRHVSGAAALLALALVTVVSAPLLAEWTAIGHQLDHRSFTAAMVDLVGGAAGVAALLWARRHLADGVVAALFGLGMLGQLVLHPTDRFGENPWKFGYAMPVTLVLLGLCAVIGKTWLELVALVALAAFSAVDDARSLSALLLMAALLLAWQHRPRLAGRTSSSLSAVAFLGLFGYTVYRTLEGAFVDGYLGSDVQQRSQAQIEQSGSLILGGRPEAGATWALFTHHPLGYGPGISPDMSDVVTAKTGMHALGYDPSNGYVERYMLGQGHFELHSLLGDFWAAYGPAGALLMLLVAGLAVRYIGHSVARNVGTALGLFLAVRTLWDVFFSPVPSTLDHLMLAVALLLLINPSAHGTDRGAVGPQVRLRARRPVASGQVRSARRGRLVEGGA
jgi:hypothetical protein